MHLQETSGYKTYRLEGDAAEADWVQHLDIEEGMTCFAEQAKARPLQVLVLYGSLRSTSYSRLLALEFARWAAAHMCIDGNLIFSASTVHIRAVCH